MKINRIISGSLLIFSFLGIYGQSRFPGKASEYLTYGHHTYVDVPSPEVASFGRYGDVGVSYFTGNPNISIPLYNFTVRDVEMPISLDYDASGVKVNSLPTWAGQNWTLNVGGVITRNVKGRYDEWIFPAQMQISNFHNYFQNHDKLLELLSYGGNYQQLKQALDSREYDFAPDEYTFHFMGKSGKFYLDSSGSWRVQSDENLEVIFDYNLESNFISPLFSKYPKDYTNDRNQRKTIAGFIIRDTNGNSYQFGYKRNAIEYTTDFWNMSKTEDNESWHAMSWYLTKVTDKYGNVLYTFDYDRGAYIVQAFNSYYLDEVKERVHGFLGNADQYTRSNNFFPYTFSISSPVYLKHISAMNGLEVTINSSYVSNELATDLLYKKLFDEYTGAAGLYTTMAGMVSNWQPTNYSQYGAFYYLAGSDNPQSDAQDSIAQFRYNPSNANQYNVLSYSRIRKLNFIEIHSSKVQDPDGISYRFFTSNTNRRLRLDSVVIRDGALYNTLTEPKGVYRFSYDRFDSLPEDYLTSAVDHWGYYNGNPFYSATNTHTPKPNLETVRNPNFTYTGIGLLNEIQYPTGGTSVFEFEPNTFSKCQTHNRQFMADTTGIGGGLRIKTIKTYDSPIHSKLLCERSFSYNIPGTNTSSGELFATPIYNWDGWRIKCENNVTYHLLTRHSSSIVPLANSTGVPLGYSYVTESIKDLSQANAQLEKHIYRFSNLSDPANRDGYFYLTFGYTNEITPYDEFSEVGFKRGRLLNEETYNADGTKVRSTDYRYRTDDCLSTHNVLISNLEQECYGTSAQYNHYIGGVYKLYDPKYDIVEKHDTLFSADGSSPQITTYTYNKIDKHYTSWLPYKHDINYRLLLSETASRGSSSEQNIYQYGQFENADAHDSLLYKSMSCIEPRVVINQKDGQTITENRTIYNTMTLNGKQCLVPSMVTSTNCHQETDTLIRYNSYTSTGRPLSYKESGQPTTYLKWAVNDSYLMLKGNDYIPFNISDEEFRNREVCYTKISQYIRNNATDLIGYIYNPLFGPVHIILPNGNETSYQYDNYGRLTGIFDYNNKQIKQFQYNLRK